MISQGKYSTVQQYAARMQHPHSELHAKSNRLPKIIYYYKCIRTVVTKILRNVSVPTKY